jgi:hypothetical protein
MFSQTADDDRLILGALLLALMAELLWCWNRKAKKWLEETGFNRAKGSRASSGSRHVVVIYQPALELVYGSDKERLEREIRRVVLHELAHHLGMSHHRMKEIGL